TRSAVGGVATFADVKLDKAGSGYTLAAASGSLAGVTSNAFTIAAGVAAQLVFTAKPTNTVAGSALSPAVKVEVHDASGNLLTTAAVPVTLAISPTSSGAT